MGPRVHVLIVRQRVSQHSWALCQESRGFIDTRAQVIEVIILTQLARKFNLTFSLLVPPSITGILVIIISIFIPIPTLTIILTLLFISSGLLVTLPVRRLYWLFGWVETKLWLVPKQSG